jgi:hypothetical protein
LRIIYRKINSFSRQFSPCLAPNFIDGRLGMKSNRSAFGGCFWRLFYGRFLVLFFARGCKLLFWRKLNIWRGSKIDLILKFYWIWWDLIGKSDLWHLSKRTKKGSNFSLDPFTPTFCYLFPSHYQCLVL